MMQKLRNKIPVYYENREAMENPAKYLEGLSIHLSDIIEAKERMTRFSGIIRTLFAETSDGIIESPLVSAFNLQKQYFVGMKGKLYLKLDSHLAVAGSIKARGGIYEVLKVTESILNEHSVKISEDHLGEIRSCLKDYTLSVASTGNLGLSIGIMSKALGFNAIVHMSKEAKQWKKDRLIRKGVQVIEHDGDFTFAAKMGREQALKNSHEHFVDDENSKDLFLGYAVAALRIKEQFESLDIHITDNQKLYLYLPCGVGGSPGGITFGFKHIFGENVKCYFAEPTNCPSMLMGVMTKKFGSLNVNDYGIDNKTRLDGLAVASPSNFVAPMMEKLCDGFYTVEDDDMYRYLYYLKKSENIKIEPSAAAGIPGVKHTGNMDKEGYHIIWTTGGLFVPDDIYDRMYREGECLCHQK
ncbi:MAG: D-serine ammonia-lyase [Clostridia bacterium]|nr:D-serine ammonia-lyase [Clostridia bacterium]